MGWYLSNSSNIRSTGVLDLVRARSFSHNVGYFGHICAAKGWIVDIRDRCHASGESRTVRMTLASGYATRSSFQKRMQGVSVRAYSLSASVHQQVH